MELLLKSELAKNRLGRSEMVVVVVNVFRSQSIFTHHI